VLWASLGHLRENGLDTTTQEFAFWSRIARTVAIVFAALLALPFVFGSLRASGSGTRTLVGVLIGIAFFFLQNLVESGRAGVQRQPAGARLVPTTLLAIAAVGFIARTR